MRTENFLSRLPCKLTDEQVHEKGAAVANAIRDVRAHQDAQKATREMAKHEEKKLTATVDLLALEVSTRTETRLVECREVADIRRLVVETIRLDTTEVIHTRPMDAAEREELRQGKLDFLDVDVTGGSDRSAPKAKH